MNILQVHAIYTSYVPPITIICAQRYEYDEMINIVFLCHKTQAQAVFMITRI